MSPIMEDETTISSTAKAIIATSNNVTTTSLPMEDDIISHHHEEQHDGSLPSIVNPSNKDDDDDVTSSSKTAVNAANKNNTDQVHSTTNCNNIHSSSLLTNGSNKNNEKVEEEDNVDERYRISPPSHILANGEFVYLPPPTILERNRLFEMDVARYNLLTQSKSMKEQEQKEEEQSKEKKQQQTRIHPLAIASARLQTHGISELSKAINLSNLVGGNEYFGLTNIVNTSILSKEPNNETTTTTATSSSIVDSSSTSSSTPIDPTKTSTDTLLSNTNTNSANNSNNLTGSVVATSSVGSNVGGVAVGASTGGMSLKQQQQEEVLKSKYLLNRKRTQFQYSHSILKRHVKRIKLTMACEAVTDRRLRQLRKRWRLIAPERKQHKLQPFPLQPQDVIAIDVRLYYNQTPQQQQLPTSHHIQPAKGGITRWIPPFATLQLDHDVWHSQQQQQPNHNCKNNDLASSLMHYFHNYDYHHPNKCNIDSKNPIEKDIHTNCDGTNGANKPKNDEEQKTLLQFPIKAHPFAVADPTLGNIDWNDDTRRIPMFTLELIIEKSFTGYKQRVTLQQKYHHHENKDEQQHEDESVIHSLQHSLFCASLFETIQQEINSTTTNTNSKSSSIAWLSSEMEELYNPAPSHMTYNSSSDSKGQKSLCVVYAHQGEIKVQLDSEYCLILQLVEETHSNDKKSNHNTSDDTQNHTDSAQNNANIQQGDSGSQSPEQLHVLCRVLLYNAQCLYHDYCREQQRKQIQHNSEMAKNNKQTMYLTKSMAKPATVDCPNILTNCVDIGNKYILERKIRKILRTIQSWITNQLPNQFDVTSILKQISATPIMDKIFQVEWLPLPLLNVKSQFAISFMDILCMDVVIDGRTITVTQFTTTSESSYRLVHLTSCDELELLIQMQILSILKRLSKGITIDNNISKHNQPAATATATATSTETQGATKSTIIIE